MPGLLQTADYARAVLEAAAALQGGGDDITDPDEVDAYAALTDRLWSVAVEDDEARALLATIAADLG